MVCKGEGAALHNCLALVAHLHERVFQRRHPVFQLLDLGPDAGQFLVGSIQALVGLCQSCTLWCHHLKCTIALEPKSGVRSAEDVALGYGRTQSSHQLTKAIKRHVSKTHCLADRHKRVCRSE